MTSLSENMDMRQYSNTTMDTSLRSNRKLFGGLVASGCGLIMQIVGVATASWSHTSFFQSYLLVTADYGPFQICVSSICAAVTAASPELKAVQATTILGTLAGAAGVLAILGVVAMAYYGKSKNAILAALNPVACILAFILILIGALVWRFKIHVELVERFPDWSFSMGFSIILDIIGGIIVMLGGIMSYWGSRIVT